MTGSELAHRSSEVTAPWNDNIISGATGVNPGRIDEGEVAARGFNKHQVKLKVLYDRIRDGTGKLLTSDADSKRYRRHRSSKEIIRRVLQASRSWDHFTYL